MINKNDWKNFKEFLAEDLKQKLVSEEYKSISEQIIVTLKSNPIRKDADHLNFLSMSAKRMLLPKYPKTVEGCLDWLISEDNTYE